MRTRIFQLFCFLFVVLFSVGADPIQLLAQPAPIVINRISDAAPLRGAVVQLQGGPFEDVASMGGSKVFIDNQPVYSSFLTETILIFVVPLDAECGGTKLHVEGPVGVPGVGTQIVESNFVAINVRCPSARGSGQFAAPRIDSVTPASGLSSQDVVTIDGENFIPPSGDDPPYTAVEFRTRDLQGAQGFSRKYGYPSFFNLGTMKMQLIDEGQLPCGVYEMQFTNFHGGGAPEITSNWYEITITEDCRDTGAPPEQNQGADIVMTDIVISPSNSVEVGTQIRIQFSIENMGNAESDAHDFTIRANNTEIFAVNNVKIGDGDSLEVNLPHTFNSGGEYTIYAEFGTYTKTAQVTVTGGAAPPPVGGNNLSDYDSDGNCELSDIEFFTLLDAWLGGSVGDGTFFGGVDAWIGGENVCSASASSFAVKLSASAQGLRVEAQDALGSVEIYNTGGRLIFTHNTSSNRFVWNMRNSLGQRVANGVYFVKVGNSSTLTKVIILRT